VPDAGGTWALPRLVGNARAMGLAMLGDKLSAEQAENWGLIWKCLDDDKLMAEAEKLAGPLQHGADQGPGPHQAGDLRQRGQHAGSSNSTSSATASANSASATTTAKASPPSWKSAHRPSRGNEMALTPSKLPNAAPPSCGPTTTPRRGSASSSAETTPGGAVVDMPVRQDMVNGHGICHGGFIFALADTNFAYACNSFNHKAVAAGVDINFIAPAHLGDTLTAVGSARHQGGRSGIYDIEVTNQDGKTIAVFRGRSTRIKGHFFDESEPKCMSTQAFICDAIRTPSAATAARCPASAPTTSPPCRSRPDGAQPKVDWARVEDVIYGCANQAGEDNRNVARMAALLAGLPVAVPGATINRLCGSGMDAVGTAARAIKAGETELMIAGGVESMSRAPFVMPKADSAFSRSNAVYDTTIGWRFVNKLMKRNTASTRCRRPPTTSPPNSR
jgi:phenylacetic acid degradation protein PaaD